MQRKHIIFTGFGGTASATSDEAMVVSPAFNEVMNLANEDLSDQNKNYLHQQTKFEKLDFWNKESVLNERAKRVVENMMFNHEAFALHTGAKEFYERLALRDDAQVVIVSNIAAEFIRAQLLLSGMNEKTIDNIVIYDVRDLGNLGGKAGVVRHFIDGIGGENAVASVEVYDSSASDRAAMVNAAQTVVDYSDVPVSVSHARALPIEKVAVEQKAKAEPVVINEAPIVTRERSKRISASDVSKHPFTMFESKRQRTDAASSKLNTFDNITRDINKRMSAEMNGVKKNTGKFGAQQASQLIAQYSSIAEFAKMAGKLDKGDLKSNDKQQQETLKLQRLNMAIETVRRNLDGTPLSADNKSAIESLLDSYSLRVQEQLDSMQRRVTLK